MATIPQKELRNNVGAILRQVEAGTTFTVTVSGRPVAKLLPTTRNQWVSGPNLANVWRCDAPQTLRDDLALLDGSVVDPFAQ